jgi:hypothetical protein
MTTQTIGRTSRAPSTIFATTAIACFAYAVLALLLMHVLRPDYTPVNHMVSDYAVGPYGWVMTTSFLAMSLGCLMLGLGLARGGPSSVAARLGTFLLGICSIGLVVSAIFPTDLDGAPSTRTGDIHTISFLVNVGCIMLASVLLSVSFGSDSRWRPYQPTAATLALLIVLAFVLQFLTLHRGMPYGLTNRLFVTLIYAWMFATSIRLRALARATSIRG